MTALLESHRLGAQMLLTTLSAVADKRVERENEINRFDLDPLLKQAAFEYRGRPDRRTAKFQASLIKTLDEPGWNPELAEDATFRAFARNMCIVGMRFGGPSFKSEKQDLHFLRVFRDHIAAHYSLLTDAHIPRNVIDSFAHLYSIDEVGRIMSDTQNVFGSNPETASIVKSAIQLVLRKKYQSVSDARTAYDGYLVEARQIFGQDEDSQKLVRTAALQVFLKRYSSVWEAKKRYDVLLREAEVQFYDPFSDSSVARTAALQVFLKQHASMTRAKGVYDRCYQSSWDEVLKKKLDERLVRGMALRKFIGEEALAC